MKRHGYGFGISSKMADSIPRHICLGQSINSEHGMRIECKRRKELVQERRLWPPFVCSPHTTWGAGKEDEGEGGDEQQVHDCGEIRSLIRTKVEEIQPMGRRMMWPSELFSMQNRWRWWLLAWKCDLLTGVRGVWRGDLQIFCQVRSKWIFTRRRAPCKSGGSRWKQINPETQLNSPSQREGGEFHNESDRCALKLPRQTGDKKNKY